MQSLRVRSAVGEERSLPSRRVASADLYEAAPWRTFRWYYGKRHYSGSYWSATQRDHVIYQSRLESAGLLFADYDQSVRHIVAQPFQLKTQVDGQSHKHVPDCLWDTAWTTRSPPTSMCT